MFLSCLTDRLKQMLVISLGVHLPLLSLLFLLGGLCQWATEVQWAVQWAAQLET
jgi:hypothetical protein